LHGSRCSIVYCVKLGSSVVVKNEDEIIRSMTFNALSEYPHPSFPRVAGWYFQQLLKFSYAFENIEDDYYLIWDADREMIYAPP
jgi:hypothetical protein